jgi:hypothetical protein
VRRLLIQKLLPLVFCAVPILAATVVALALPTDARNFYLGHISSLDWIILTLGLSLFAAQMFLLHRCLSVRDGRFDERGDKWISNLGQAAEWFPLLGLLGTVAGILQTFASIKGQTDQAEIIRLYAPALTATGTGLFMALINIFPTWMVMVGRDVILALGGDPTSKQ